MHVIDRREQYFSTLGNHKTYVYAREKPGKAQQCCLAQLAGLRERRLAAGPGSLLALFGALNNLARGLFRTATKALSVNLVLLQALGKP